MSHKISPQFIGLGAGYAGLGHVTRWLEDHPQIADKIPVANFFNTAIYEKKGLEWYKQHINTAKKPGQLLGDCTPGYLSSEKAAERIVQAYPDAKIFVILRNPLKRALAEFIARQNIDAKARNVTAVQYLTTHPELQTQGFYIDHMSNYLAYYSPLVLHVIFYEDLIANPLSEMQRLYEFVGVDKHFIPKALERFAPPPDEPKNPSRIKRMIIKIKKVKEDYKNRQQSVLFEPEPDILGYMSELDRKLFLKAFKAPTERLSHVLGNDMCVYWEVDTE